MEPLTTLQKIIVWPIPVLFAITVHEVAHGWVARRLGDQTAWRLGRLTLNPVKHVDLVGTIIVPALMLMFTPFVLGWAKPVPVDWRNLRKPKTDMIWVALAGPGSNFLMACAWALVLRVVVHYHQALPWIVGPLVLMCIAGVFVNSLMMVLNLLPLPPLDGGRVLTGLLPPALARRVGRIEPFGIFILIALLASGVLSKVLNPAVSLVFAGYASVAGTNFETFWRLLRIILPS